MPDALLVRVQDTRLALPLSGEQTIAEVGPVAPLPHGEPLLRGLTTVQGRAVPLLHEHLVRIGFALELVQHSLADMAGSEESSGTVVFLLSRVSELADRVRVKSQR